MIIGVGGAGRNIVKHMYEEDLQDTRFITIGDYSGG